jgi:hypothetical protein
VRPYPGPVPPPVVTPFPATAAPVPPPVVTPFPAAVPPTPPPAPRPPTPGTPTPGTPTPEMIPDPPAPGYPQPAGGRLRRAVVAAVGALWPVVVVTLVVTVEIRFLARSTWRPTFLYDGDTLVFAILWRDLAEGQAMHPVMSSQLLIFPEGAVYALAYAVTTSVTASLVLDAYLNVLLFYVAARAAAASVVGGSAQRRRLAAAASTVLLVGAMLLERTMAVDHTAIATPFLFDDFYNGVLIAGVASIAFAAVQLRWQLPGAGRARLLASTLVAVGLGVVTSSDPLYILMVAAPFVAVAVALRLLRVIPARLLLWVSGPQVGGVAVYEALRPVWSRYLGAPVGNYVTTGRITPTAEILDRCLDGLLGSAAGRAEVALVAAAWRARPRLATAGDRGRALLGAFAAVASVSIIGAVILVGDPRPRYLLPTAVLPFVGLLPAWDRVLARRWSRPARLVPVVAATALATLGVTAISGALSVLRPEPAPESAVYGSPLGERCLEAALGHRAADGVAAYWTARAVGLYAGDDDQVLQVKTDLAVYPWLVNLGSYEDRRFTFVLVDRDRHGKQTLRPRDAVAVLGPPDGSSVCPAFDVYRYPPGTLGYRILNGAVDGSLREDLRRYA